MGELSIAAHGTATARLRLSRRNSEAAQAALQALAQQDARQFWLCHQVEPEPSGTGLSLHFAKSVSQVIPLAHLVARWRKEPAIYLLRALSLAQYLVTVTGLLEQLRPNRFPLSPAQVCCLVDEDGKERWTVLPIAAVGVDVADFVAADECSWIWLSSDELLGVAQSDKAYLMGAVLHYCLVADLFSCETDRAGRVRRLLTYRAGQPAQTHRALAAALPKSRVATARELTDFIHAVLAPRQGRPLTPASATQTLDRFQSTLTAPQLAWEWEEQPPGYAMIARGILEEMVCTTSDSDIPWESVRRLRALTGDAAGAADAERRVRVSTDGDPLVTLLRHLLALGDERKEELRTLIEGLSPGRTTNGESTPAHSEDECLYLAYASARGLQQPDRALAWLNCNFTSSWRAIVCSVLRARILLDANKWTDAARSCKEAKRLAAKLPDAESRSSRYISGYLELLDGIAHLCAVVMGSYSAQYLNDAFTRFESAWNSSAGAQSDELRSDVSVWLAWMGQSAATTAGLKALAIGIDAFLEGEGLTPAQLGSGDGQRPALPWFEEMRLFPR